MLHRPAASPLVRVQGLSKIYRDGPSETRVLHGVTLELARGQTTSLTGVSGSGKSTLVSLLAGLLLPDSGEILFDGRDVTDLDDRDRARLRSRRVGVVLQRGNLIPFLTALENVELAIKLAGVRRPAKRAEELLAQLELGDRAHHLPRRMSGGEAQRAAIAVALANEPDILLADEVTGELDSSSAEQVMRVIFDVWSERGLTVFYVTHNAELAARAQHSLRLENGEVHPA